MIIVIIAYLNFYWNNLGAFWYKTNFIYRFLF